MLIRVTLICCTGLSSNSFRLKVFPSFKIQAYFSTCHRALPGCSKPTWTTFLSPIMLARQPVELIHCFEMFDDFSCILLPKDSIRSYISSIYCIVLRWSNIKSNSLKLKISLPSREGSPSPQALWENRLAKSQVLIQIISLDTQRTYTRSVAHF